MVGNKIEECILELEKVKDMDTTYIKQLQQDLPANRKFIGDHQILKSGFKLKNVANELIDAVAKNVKSKFPSIDILDAYSDPPLCHLSSEVRVEYANKEI